MASEHIVTDGETLRTIASTYGVPPDRIWGAPQNAELRRARDPNVLAPGDRLWIPDPEAPQQQANEGGAPARTGGVHQFVPLALQRLEIKWLNHAGEPLANWSYRIEAPEGTVSGALDGDGVMIDHVPVLSRRVSVRVEAPSCPSDDAAALQTGLLAPQRERALLFSTTLSIGTLNPMHPPATDELVQSACVQRLTNPAGTWTHFALQDGAAQRGVLLDAWGDASGRLSIWHRAASGSGVYRRYKVSQ